LIIFDRSFAQPEASSSSAIANLSWFVPFSHRSCMSLGTWQRPDGLISQTRRRRAKRAASVAGSLWVAPGPLEDIGRGGDSGDTLDFCLGDGALIFGGGVLKAFFFVARSTAGSFFSFANSSIMRRLAYQDGKMKGIRVNKQQKSMNEIDRLKHVQTHQKLSEDSTR